MVASSTTNAVGPGYWSTWSCTRSLIRAKAAPTPHRDTSTGRTPRPGRRAPAASPAGPRASRRDMPAVQIGAEASGVLACSSLSTTKMRRSFWKCSRDSSTRSPKPLPAPDVPYHPMCGISAPEGGEEHRRVAGFAEGHTLGTCSVARTAVSIGRACPTRAGAAAAAGLARGPGQSAPGLRAAPTAAAVAGRPCPRRAAPGAPPACRARRAWPLAPPW